MTDTVVPGSMNTDLVSRVEKPPQRGETVRGRTLRTIPGGKSAHRTTAAAHAGATVSMTDPGDTFTASTPHRRETEREYAS